MPIDSFDLDHDGDALESWSLDQDGAARFRDVPNVHDIGIGQGNIVDCGCYERSGT